MGMGNFKHLSVLLLGLSFGLTLTAALTACHKNKAEETDSSIITLAPLKATSDELSKSAQKWHVTNQRIIVFLGYGFNDAAIKENILDGLSERYGLDADGGLIYPIVYPDDFKHGSKNFSSELYSKLQLEGKDCAGIIMLGAPENTHYALARNQDTWNQEVPYPVIALFSQDDFLGLESTCDIVIDKGHIATLAGEIENEDTEVQLVEEAPEVLNETINYVSALNYSLPKNSTIQAHVLKMLEGRSIHHYTDPETGLQSINHFVLN